MNKTQQKEKYDEVEKIFMKQKITLEDACKKAKIKMKEYKEICENLRRDSVGKRMHERNKLLKTKKGGKSVHFQNEITDVSDDGEENKLTDDEEILSSSDNYDGGKNENSKNEDRIEDKIGELTTKLLNIENDMIQKKNEIEVIKKELISLVEYKLVNKNDNFFVVDNQNGLVEFNVQLSSDDDLSALDSIEFSDQYRT